MLLDPKKVMCLAPATQAATSRDTKTPTRLSGRRVYKSVQPRSNCCRIWHVRAIMDSGLDYGQGSGRYKYMNSENNIVAPKDDDSIEEIALEADLTNEEADRQIKEAVTGRQNAVRKYIRWIRRRSPDATPAEVITVLGQSYISAITAAGAAVTVGGIAAEIGIALIPGGGVVKGGAKAIAKSAALGVAKSGAQMATNTLLPAGEEQIQFEITALYALAIAEIHGIEYDQQQAQALVYGLTNGQISHQRVSSIAENLTKTPDTEVAIGCSKEDNEKKHPIHWANTLADSLPNESAQNFVRNIQSGVLENTQIDLSGKQQTAIECGVGAVTGGITKFVFGREVVEAANLAFSEAPLVFPDYLDVPTDPEPEEGETNQALEALEEAARAVSEQVRSGSEVVAKGVTVTADKITRPFRSVDLDGDGVSDEPQALIAAKGFGRLISGAAKSVGSAVDSPFKHKRHGSRAGDAQRSPESE